MGIIASLFGYGANTGRTDDPDPITGLTSRDRYLITRSWDLVMKDPTGNGIKLFMRLFEINPKYHQLFPFKNVPYKDLPQNKRFQAHCNTIIYSFASIVSVIEDFELWNNITEKLGTSHATRKVDEQALKDVKQAMIDIFSFMNEEQLATWSKVLDLSFQKMNEAIRERQMKEKD